MVRLWFMDDNVSQDKRLENKASTYVKVSIEDIWKHNIKYWHFDPTSYENNPKFSELKRKYRYLCQDPIEYLPEKLEEYSEDLNSSYDEHFHTSEEVVYVLDGSAYYDFRDLSDRWMRIKVTKGDMIALPSGIYHRFTLDTNNYFKAVRLFKKWSDWTKHFRSNSEENNPTVKSYQRYISSNEFKEKTEIHRKQFTKREHRLNMKKHGMLDMSPQQPGSEIAYHSMMEDPEFIAYRLKVLGC